MRSLQFGGNLNSLGAKYVPTSNLPVLITACREPPEPDGNGMFWGRGTGHGKVTFCAGALAPAVRLHRGRTPADERPTAGRHRPGNGPEAGVARPRSSLPPPPSTPAVAATQGRHRLQPPNKSPFSSTAASGTVVPSTAGAVTMSTAGTGRTRSPATVVGTKTRTDYSGAPVGWPCGFGSTS